MRLAEELRAADGILQEWLEVLSAKQAAVQEALMVQVHPNEPAPAERICRGTLLSRQQYLHETNVVGYRDARELEVKGWTGDASYPVKSPNGAGGKSDANRRGR